MLLEILPEERLVGEMQMLGNLLDAHGRVLQQYPHLKRHEVIYPLIGCPSAHLFHRLRQIFGCDAQLLPIPAHPPFLSEVLLHQFNERGKDSLSPGLPLVIGLLQSVNRITDIIDHCHHDRPYHIGPEMVILLVHLIFQCPEIEINILHFDIVQGETGCVREKRNKDDSS